VRSSARWKGAGTLRRVCQQEGRRPCESPVVLDFCRQVAQVLFIQKIEPGLLQQTSGIQCDMEEGRDCEKSTPGLNHPWLGKIKI